LTEQPDRFLCLKCRRDGQSFHYVDLLERVRLADDPADPDVGHFCLETIHIMQCPACGHRQERLHRRTPYATLREAQSQLDAHLLGKG
jgi:rubrerythrin